MLVGEPRERCQLFGSLTIKDLLKHKQHRTHSAHLWPPLVSIYETSSLKDALALMQRHHLTALPVFQYQGSLTKAPVELNYTGIISVYDILANAIFQKFFEDFQYLESFDESDSFQRYLKLMEEQQAFASTQVKDLLGSTSESSRSAASLEKTSLSLESTLLDLIHRFVHDHRVLIRDPQDPSHVAMITQTDLLTFLMESDQVHSRLQDILQSSAMRACEMALKLRGPSDIDADPNQPVTVKKHVISVPSNYQALSAFRVMYRHRVSALALVDKEHQLVGCLSASDLRGLVMDRLSDLLLPTNEFLKMMRTQGQGLTEALPEPKLVTTLPDSPLIESIQKALAERIHRVFVVDQQNHPTGIITFSDIISILMV